MGLKFNVFFIVFHKTRNPWNLRIKRSPRLTVLTGVLLQRLCHLKTAFYHKIGVYFPIMTLIYVGFPKTMSECDVRFHLNELD